MKAPTRISRKPYIGEVPWHWLDISLKHLLRAPVTDGPHETPVFVDESEGRPFLSVDAIQEGELVLEGCRYVAPAAFDEYRRKAAPEIDDILMGKAASTGKIARVKTATPFAIWSPLALIRPRQHELDSRFLEYLLKSAPLQQQIDDLCNANTQKNIGMGDIPRLAFALPPIAEQERIANFLDEQTARIDALIAEKEALLEKLTAYRAAVIEALVSGEEIEGRRTSTRFEFCRTIPESWVMRRLKHISPAIVVGIVVNPSEYYSDEGRPFVFGGDISEDGIRVDTKRRISDAGNAANPKSVLRAGDLVTVRVGEPGTTAVVTSEFDGANCASVMLTRGSSSFDAHWLAACMNSTVGKSQVDLVAYGAAMKQFNISHAREFWFPVPPRQVQSEIASQVAEVRSRAGRLTNHVEEHIERLREYRSSLISAAVTGQLAVQ